MINPLGVEHEMPTSSVDATNQGGTIRRTSKRHVPVQSKGERNEDQIVQGTVPKNKIKLHICEHKGMPDKNETFIQRARERETVLGSSWFCRNWPNSGSERKLLRAPNRRIWAEETVTGKRKEKKSDRNRRMVGLFLQREREREEGGREGEGGWTERFENQPNETARSY